MIIVWVLIIFTVLIFTWGVSTYNFFVSSKTRIKAAVQEIGNQLKRQADLIPNLEESAKGYLKHEKNIYENLTQARRAIAEAVKSGDVQKMADAGSMLSTVIPNIQVLVESNPELKSSEVISKLMDELRDTADKLMYARRLLIDLTADFNVKRVTFPSSIIASLFKFSELQGIVTPESVKHLEVEVKELETPKVKFR